MWKLLGKLRVWKARNGKDHRVHLFLKRAQGLFQTPSKSMEKILLLLVGFAVGLQPTIGLYVKWQTSSLRERSSNLSILLGNSLLFTTVKNYMKYERGITIQGFLFFFFFHCIILCIIFFISHKDLLFLVTVGN